MARPSTPTPRFQWLAWRRPENADFTRNATALPPTHSGGAWVGTSSTVRCGIPGSSVQRRAGAKWSWGRNHQAVQSWTQPPGGPPSFMSHGTGRAMHALYHPVTTRRLNSALWQVPDSSGHRRAGGARAAPMIFSLAHHRTAVVLSYGS
jgi:hypothetical protein